MSYAMPNTEYIEREPLSHGPVMGDSADELVARYGQLVKRIAYHLKGRLPESVPVEDLMQAGMLGLLESAANFQEGQGASFETFVGIRIRGAMLDEVRRQDWSPRSVYRKSRELAEATRAVENRVGRDAEDHEVAKELGLSLDEYFRLRQDASSQRVISVDEGEEEGHSLFERLADQRPNPEEGLEQWDMRSRLVQAIDELPERERLVMALYYDEELNLKEIGQVLGVSESRVCQIHSQVLKRLRSGLADSPTP